MPRFESSSLPACALLLCTTCHLSRCFLPHAYWHASCPVLRADCSKLRLPARPWRQQRKSGRAPPKRAKRLCVDPSHPLGRGLPLPLPLPTRVPPVPLTFFPPNVSAQWAGRFKKHTWGYQPGPQLGPSFAQTLENTVLFYVFDGWKGAKCGNLLNSEAMLIPI